MIRNPCSAQKVPISTSIVFRTVTPAQIDDPVLPGVRRYVLNNPYETDPDKQNFVVFGIRGIYGTGFNPPESLSWTP